MKTIFIILFATLIFCSSCNFEKHEKEINEIKYRTVQKKEELMNLELKLKKYSLDHVINSLIKIKTINSDALLPDQNGVIESDYSYGTGFYISKSGLFLTAQHVIKNRSKFNSDPITCLDMNNSKAFGPIIEFEDEKNDIALLRNPNPVEYENYIDINNINEIKKGLGCYCIGFPQEVQNFYKMVSLSHGKIQYILKNLKGYNKLPYRKKVFITSCDVVSGFSGGIVIDEYFQPLGLIVGSIENRNALSCYAKRINEIQKIIGQVR
jgi:S1-C subfamily serine protease